MPTLFLWFGIPALVGMLLWKTRQFIQGYWFDRSAPSPRLLTGQNALVTGANSGLGLAVSIELARLGAKVFMACRSQTRGEAALKEVREAVSGCEVELVLLDVASMESVEALASTWNRPLHVLVCNAGIAVVPSCTSPVTPDTGVCTVLQTNYLGHYHLTHLLLKHIKAAADT
eukprot:TRINITY_DN18123_c0_g1_i1.p1 TRINITY_DN18123_c0_g1~~TRINITY_DN18123_c0_g1_i1.p1  ORF type:complete len:173 (+),score=27.91 TRINITY_DN18123_c0_g1_i1:206-724(+)